MSLLKKILLFKVILFSLLLFSTSLVHAQSKRNIRKQLAAAIKAEKKRSKTESDTIEHIIQIMKGLELKMDSVKTERNNSSSIGRMQQDVDSLKNELYSYQIHEKQYREALDRMGKTKKVSKRDLRNRIKSVKESNTSSVQSGKIIKNKVRRALEIYNKNLEEGKLVSVKTYFRTGRHILEQSERSTLLSWFDREVRGEIDLSDENETKLLEFEISGYADGQTYRTNDELKTKELTIDRALFTARYLKSIVDAELVGSYTINYYDNEQPFNDDQQADYIKQRVEELIINDAENTTNKLYIIFTYRGLSRAIPPNVVPNGREDDINRRISVVQVIRHYRPIID